MQFDDRRDAGHRLAGRDRGDSTSNTPARRVFREAVLVAVIGVLGAAGLVARPFSAAVADMLWLAATVVALVPAAVWVFQDLRRGRYGADLLALVALGVPPRSASISRAR